MHTSDNPVIRHIFTSDPCVLVHDEKIWLFTGHDDPPEGVDDYVMNDWRCFSSGDLADWQEYPVPLAVTEFSWVKKDAFASSVVHRNGKFYWYAAVTHATIAGKAIAVAVADRPEGPYHDARGSALIDQTMIPDPDIAMANMDPSVFIDDDGQAYIFWGNSLCYYARLDQDMTEINGEISRVELPGFNEGAQVYKRNGWYYLAYGYGFPEKVAYAMSRSIHGPWLFKGILNELAGNCETNRPAIVDFRGRSYFFYHNGALKQGGSHRRSVCVDDLFYEEDGTMKRVIMTSEGVKRIT
ncbi:MAG: family 43 glycosylhydrolase [Mucilaginibacter polytrichastri]|nr:family 43 glycosylhydrolase [Mucilaginibacter polytrichastri]